MLSPVLHGTNEQLLAEKREPETMPSKSNNKVHSFNSLTIRKNVNGFDVREVMEKNVSGFLLSFSASNFKLTNTRPPITGS